MPASDEFPRGWTASAIQSGAAAALTVVIPAVAGVAHVLTDADFIIITGTDGLGGAAIGFQQCSVQAASIGTIILSVLGVSQAAANVINKDEGTFTGRIAAGVGEAMTIAFASANGAGQGQLIRAQGFSI